MYHSLGKVVLDQIGIAFLGEKLANHVGRYSECGNATEALDKRLLCNERFFATIALFVQIKTMDAAASQCRFAQLGSTSMASCASKDTALAADASFVQEAPARNSSESSSKERCKVRKQCGTQNPTCIGNCWMRSKM